MTEEETDNDDPALFVQHKPSWRSEGDVISTHIQLCIYVADILPVTIGLNKLIKKLDKRWSNGKKQPTKKRVDGTVSGSPVPKDAPIWAVAIHSVGHEVIGI